MAEDIFKGLDSFLKNNNTAAGVMDQKEIEAPEEKEEVVEVPEEKGLTLEELEAEMKQSAETSKETSDNEEGEEKDSEESDDNQAEENEDSDVWKGLSAMLKDKGIVEEEFDSPDKMVEVFGKEVEKGVNDWIDSLPDEAKAIVEAASQGIKGQSLLSFIESKDNQIQLEGIEDSRIEEDVDLAKSIVKAHLRSTTRMDDAKINKHVARLEDLDELVAEALEAKSALIEINKEAQEEIKERNKAEREASAKRNEELAKQIYKTVTETKEIIPGIKLSEKEQKELHKMIVTPVELRGNTPISAAMKLREQDPIEFEKKLNYFIMKGFFDGKFDDVIKTAQTKVVGKVEKDLEEAAKKLISKTNATSRREENPDTKPNLIDAWKRRKV